MSKVKQFITDYIIKSIEKGCEPWRKPWLFARPSSYNAGKPVYTDGPRNHVSGHVYTGINRWIAACTEYDCPEFITLKQAKAKGLWIDLKKHGKNYTPIVFWSFMYVDENGKKVKETDDWVRKIPSCKFYKVWNMEQVEGFVYNPVEETKPKVKKTPKPENPYRTDAQKIKACESFIEGYLDKPEIEEKHSNRAYYHPSKDIIVMPMQKQFKNDWGYYRTMFHELAHSTGHVSRLNRKFGFQGTQDYAKEELVAELAACMASNVCGLPVEKMTGSASYIEGWKSRLNLMRSDENAIFQAASKAEKALIYMQTGEKK